MFIWWMRLLRFRAFKFFVLSCIVGSWLRGRLVLAAWFLLRFFVVFLCRCLNECVRYYVGLV